MHLCEIKADSPILQTLWHYPRTITTAPCFRCVLHMLNFHLFLLAYVLYCLYNLVLFYRMCVRDWLALAVSRVV